MKLPLLFATLLLIWSACSSSQPKASGTGTTPSSDISAYKGTASVTQGLAKTTAEVEPA